MESQKISTNFSKGLNLSISHMISLEEVQTADNFMFSNGAFVREGTVVNASLPYPIVTLKKHYKKDGTSYITAIAGGLVYLSYTSGVFTNTSCETLVSGDVSVTAYDDYLYFSNMSNVVKAFDGSSIDNVGLSGPAFTKYLGDFENNSGWSVSNCAITKDFSYLHIDRGENALLFGAPATTKGAALNGSNRFDLSVFAPSVPSVSQDLIQVFTVPAQKVQVSSLVLRFQNPGSPSASVVLTDLSSWVYSSNDSWSMAHTVPKELFTINGGFSWADCAIQIELESQTGVSSAVAVDNVRLLKTPPLLETKAISGDGLYFGYVAAKTDRYALGTSLTSGWVIPKQWASLSSASCQIVMFRNTPYQRIMYPSTIHNLI